MSVKVIIPGDGNYIGLDRGFNQRFVLDPAIITKPDLETSGLTAKRGIHVLASEADVLESAQAVFDSTSEKSALRGRIRVISGGHCYENFVFDATSNTKTQAVFDVSNMNRIERIELGAGDQMKTYITVEPGVTNWQLASALFSLFGRCIPGGSCYSVAAGGHICGGGYGLLSRLHALTVDYLAGVNMITFSGTDGAPELRTFDPALPEDAHNRVARGAGGGSYGIITKYYFEESRLPVAPEHALFYTIEIPWSKIPNHNAFHTFLTSYYDACAQLPGQAFTLGKFTYKTSDDDAMHILIQVVYGNGSGHDSAATGVGTDIPEMNRAEAILAIETFVNALSDFVSAESRNVRSKPAVQIKTLMPGHPINGSFDQAALYELPWIELTQMLNGSGDNQNGKYKSSYLMANYLPDEAGAMYDFLTNSGTGNLKPDTADGAQTLIQIDSYGGQVNTAGQGNTMIAARNSNLKSQYQTYWKDYEDDDPETKQSEIINWINTAYVEIHKAGGTDGFPDWSLRYQGCYFNYPDIQLGTNDGFPSENAGGADQNFLETYFGEDTASVLRTLKAELDPYDVFRFAQSCPMPDPT